MENIDLISSTQPTTAKISLAAGSESKAAQQKTEKFCKDFESIFITRLLDEMKDTIGDWGGEQDEAAKQTQGLFWMYLAQDMGDKGGFGLWKQMYNQLTGGDSASAQNKNIEVEI
jgi:Rod binding domain-containing protein